MSKCLGPANQRGNLPQTVAQLRKGLSQYTKDVFSKKREAATHLMIFMVADERRDMKPYAIPVRALPFKSITDAKVRQLRDELKLEMVNLGMVVGGLFSLPYYIYIYIYIYIYRFAELDYLVEDIYCYSEFHAPCGAIIRQLPKITDTYGDVQNLKIQNNA